MNNTEYYDRLGVSKDASQDEIKRAYRKMSKKYHPDINKEPGAEEKYKEVQEAYETLSDDQKRAAYDQYGPDGANAGFGGQGGFGGFDGGAGFGGFEDINVDTQTPLGVMRRQVTCDVCHGTGQEIKDPCQTCHGTGHEKQSHKVSVKIPAGVETGQQIRLAGQGEAGFNGGPYGDLFVIINVNPSDKFTRDGSTIYYTLNISFVQAALGDTVEVPTVHGNVEMTIPAGTQTGKTFRLKGKGAPRLRGGSQGDQHVTVKIVTPTKLNDAQKEALLAFAKASGDEKIAPQKKGFFNKVKDALEDL